MSKLNDLINKFCPHGVEYVKLGDIATVSKGKQLNKSNLLSDGKYAVINGGVKPTGYWNEYNYSSNRITVSQGGSCGFVDFQNKPFWAGAHCYVIVDESSSINYNFLYYILKNKEPKLMKLKHGAGIPSLAKSIVENLKIPLPPLRVQEKIVKILDKFTDLENELENELRMRKMQFNAYRDKLLTFDNGVRFEKLGDLGSFIGGLKGKSKKDFRDGNNKLITYKNVYNNMAIDQNLSDKVKIEKNESQNVLQYGDICFTGSSETLDESGLSSVVTDVPTSGLYLNSFCFLFRFNNVKLMNPNFSKYLFRSNLIRKQICRIAQGVTRFNISKKGMNDITIPVPPIEKQKEIVEKLDKFNDMCNEISEGLPLEIELRKKQKKTILNQLLKL